MQPTRSFVKLLNDAKTILIADQEFDLKLFETILNDLPLEERYYFLSEIRSLTQTINNSNQNNFASAFSDLLNQIETRDQLPIIKPISKAEVNESIIKEGKQEVEQLTIKDGKREIEEPIGKQYSSIICDRLLEMANELKKWRMSSTLTNVFLKFTNDLDQFLTEEDKTLNSEILLEIEQWLLKHQWSNGFQSEPNPQLLREDLGLIVQKYYRMAI